MPMLPYSTPTVWLGARGLNLNLAVDHLSVEELSRVSNLYYSGQPPLLTRPGQTEIASTAPGDPVHSVRRLNTPQTGTYTRFWGAGSIWYRGQSGALAVLETGFSGDPLTQVTTRPFLTGEPWMVVADRLKLRKTSRTLAAPPLPLGLPIPPTPSTSLLAVLTTSIASFDASDATAAANWSKYGSPSLSGGGSAATPVLTDVAGLQGNAVSMQTLQGTAAGPYLATMFLAKAINLSTLQGGARPAADDDLVHLWVRIDEPTNVEEFRVYFVCSPFTGNQLAIPGTIPNINTDAYVRAYRPSDLAGFTAATQTALGAAGQTLVTGLVQEPFTPDTQQLPDAETTTPSPGLSVPPTSAARPGAGLWTEFGGLGTPVRRGEFLKIGNAGDPGLDWATITGIVIVVQVKTGKTVNIAFDDGFLTGGGGADTSDPGSQKYDYRLTNYDPRTGAESNGSAVQAESAWLDSLRNPLHVTPTAPYGDAAIRQRAYRRGGNLTDNWYFAGVNTSDGGGIDDYFDDTDLATESILPTDHFQPVATVDASGNTVLNQPIPIVFGPFDDGTYCGLGDPYRPGHLYASLPGEIDHWPSTGAYVREVCSPAEELMNGGIWAGQGFVLSRERGYTVVSNLASGSPGIVTSPTECTPGLAARWGFTIGPGGIYYVARDGVRVTNGQASTILDGDRNALYPLFHGTPTNGYLPIDWAHPEAIRLEIYDLRLWLLYLDTGGNRQCLVYSLLDRYWTSYDFARDLACVYNDEATGAAAIGGQRAILGATNGFAYDHSGFTDDGVAIPWSLRTGSWDFGANRAPKLLGDLSLSASLHGESVSLRAYLDVETSSLGPVTIASVGSARSVYRVDQGLLGASPLQAVTVAFDLSGNAPLAAVLELAHLTPSIVALPDVTDNRAWDWSTWGSLSDKYLKGFLLEADTYGQLVDLVIEADGAVAATITVQHTGRTSRGYTFSQILGRIFRLRPKSARPVQVFQLEPIFDEEPYALARWETQLLDFSLPGSGWGSILSGDICYRTAVDCTLAIQSYNSEGGLTATVSRPLLSTAGAKLKRFVPMPPNKGVLFKLVFTTIDGSDRLTLYQEESRLRVKPWASDLALIRVFGNDDLDQTRAMTSATGAASRSGGGTA